MKNLHKILFFLALIFSVKYSNAQEPKITDKIANKVVIGFPNISISQLNNITSTFANYEQIQSAKFIKGNHDCMLIDFDLSKKNFTVYAELLKVISSYYDISKCYFKVIDAYNEINGNIGTDTIIVIK
ncbi:MAG: hypothetical protein LCH32_02505 [Bacteroidetes bacterium]|nr:hypothetical protein [Bacteroidota bacterium]